MKLRHIELSDLDPDLTGTHRKSRPTLVRTTSPTQKKKGNHKVIIKTSNKARCPGTGKRRLRDEKEAKLALRSTRFKGQVEREVQGASKRAEKRYYLCNHCGALHLTSQTEAEYRSAYGKAA